MDRNSMTLGFMGPDLFSGTGYGQLLGYVMPKVRSLGYGVVNIGNQHFSSVINLKGIYTTPRYKHPYSIDVIPYFIKRLSITKLISVVDPWVLNELIDMGIPYVNWIPIDSELLNEHAMPEDTLKMLRGAEDTWAITRFGQEQFAHLGIEAKHVPVGVDHEVFQKRQLKERVFKQDFILGWVGRNITNRKGQAEMFEGYKLFTENYLSKQEAQNVGLYMHTNPGVLGEGYDLSRMVKYYGLENSNIYLPSVDLRVDVLAEPDLAELYNSFSAFVSTSRAEGFNSPLMEAMSCSLPIIAHNVTANRELLDGTDAVKVKSSNALDVPMYTPVYSRMPIVDVDDLAKAMYKVYTMSEDERERIGKSAYVRSTCYSWDKTVAVMDNILQQNG